MISPAGEPVPDGGNPSDEPERDEDRARTDVADEDDVGEDRVRVQIRNRPGTTPGVAVPSTGVGIIGMTERAETLAGSLRARPTPDGGFEVEATIPYQGPASMGDPP